MGVDAYLYMYDVVVKKFTFAISFPDEFLLVELLSIVQFYVVVDACWYCQVVDRALLHSGMASNAYPPVSKQS